MAGAGSGEQCSSFFTWILMTTGVTCAALIYDMVQRYVIHKPEDKENAATGIHVSEEVTTQLNLTLSKLQALEADRKSSAKEEQLERARLVEAADKVALASEAPIIAKQSASSLQQSRARPALAFEDDEDDIDGGSLDVLKQEGGAVSDPGIRWLVNDLVDALRCNVQQTVTQDDLSEQCREQLGNIAQLEEPCNTLSVEFDKCAVLMVRRGDEESEAPEAEQAQEEVKDNLAVFQSRRAALRSKWAGIRRIFYCIDVHLKNAADYHQFYYELDQLQKIFDQFNSNITAALEKDVVHVKNLEELQNFDKSTQNSLKNLRLWDATLSRMAEQCKSIVPVHMRTEPLEESIPARALCSYTREEKTITDILAANYVHRLWRAQWVVNGGCKFSVNEGDTITLKNNEDEYEWQIETVSGNSGILPAVCCLIPPPDTSAAKELARLRQSLREALVSAKIQFQRRLIVVAKDIIGDILKNKRHCIAVIHPENKVKMLADIASMEEMFGNSYSTDEDWPELQDMLQELKKAITDAKEEGEEAECLKEVMSMLSTLTSITTTYQSFLSTIDSHKTLHYSKIKEENSPNGSEWDTLDDLEQAKREMTLGVSVRRESTQIGETSTIESASGETRSTFSIKGVLDTRDFTEMSMDDAIRKGIIDQRRGIFKNMKTGEEIPIPTAMNQGFIKVESTQVKKTRELKKAVGLVTVKYTRESRPYSVKAILDPRTDAELTVAKAIEDGVFDPKRERWCNPDTGEEMTVENAIDCGGFLVDYDTEAEVTEPEVSEKTFAVFGVLDRKAGKRLPFHEASERGLIDKEEGIYTDTLTGSKMHVVEAFKHNYVRGRVIEDPKQLEYYLGEGMPRSRDSSTSDASLG